MNRVVDEARLLGALETVLRRVPSLSSLSIRREGKSNRKRFDAVVSVQLGELDPQRWIVEVRSVPVEPYLARAQALVLSEAAEELEADYAVVVAPFVSERSTEILKRSGVGSCDLSGNCHLACGPLLVERSGFPNAFARKASHGSLFTPGSERVLRAVLDPANLARAWKVRDLAEAAWPGVSVGQAHKVAKRLEKEAYLERVEGGLGVRDPEKLLEEWVAGYRAERSRERRYYSPLNPGDLRERLAALVEEGLPEQRLGAIASFSAAELVAPHVRQHRFFAYWAGESAAVEERLELKAVSIGENVVIRTPYDEGVLYPAAHDRWPVTSPVQTYLDLRKAPGRGEEAAQEVFDRWLKGAYAR